MPCTATAPSPKPANMANPTVKYVFMTLLPGEMRGEKSARSEALNAPACVSAAIFWVVSPAAGTNAAVDRRGYGTSRRQLAASSYTALPCAGRRDALGGRWIGWSCGARHVQHAGP